MSWWLVVGPEFYETIPIMDDGSGPLEYFRDAVYVTASNAREAKHVALRCFRKWFNRKGHYDPGYCCPWEGMTVEPTTRGTVRACCEENQ